MPPVYLFDHPLFRQHETGPGHPERPERLDAIVSGLRRRKLADRFEWVTPSVAPAGSAELVEREKHLRRVHTEAHVAEILALRGKSDFIDADTRVSPASVDAALTATGACVEAVDRVVQNPGASAFCAVRPPGHHAERDAAMGFCLFNHVAAAAAYATAEKGVERVLIFDPDVHHGNGTQDIFYARGDVCYVSIHQSHFYPGTGLASETGEGEGKGATVNLPLPAGMGDSEYRFAVEQVVLPLIRSFAPGLVIFSAGFDAHNLDPLGGMRLTSHGFVTFYSAILSELSARKVPSFFSLEGGYSLEALEETAPMLLKTLLDGPVSPPAWEGEPHAAARELVAELGA